MRDIGGDSGCAPNVKQAQLGHERVLLEQQRQRLADTTCGTQSNNVGMSDTELTARHGTQAIGRPAIAYLPIVIRANKIA